MHPEVLVLGGTACLHPKSKVAICCCLFTFCCGGFCGAFVGFVLFLCPPENYSYFDLELFVWMRVSNDLSVNS